jgi:hypothetical protein
LAILESLLRRLPAITNGKGNHRKPEPEEPITQAALFRAKSVSIKRWFNLNIHDKPLYLAPTEHYARRGSM